MNLQKSTRSGTAAPECIRKMLTNVTKLKRILVRYAGWALLYMGKPFTATGNWFWKMHRKVLSINK